MAAAAATRCQMATNYAMHANTIMFPGPIAAQRRGGDGGGGGRHLAAAANRAPLKTSTPAWRLGMWVGRYVL